MPSTVHHLTLPQLLCIIRLLTIILPFYTKPHTCNNEACALANIIIWMSSITSWLCISSLHLGCKIAINHQEQLFQYSVFELLFVNQIQLMYAIDLNSAHLTISSRYCVVHVHNYAWTDNQIIVCTIRISICYVVNLYRNNAILTSMTNTIMNATYQYSPMLKILPQCSIINIHANKFYAR